MEGLGKSEGKAAIFAFQKMSPRAWEGVVWGCLYVVRPWRELDRGAEAGAAQQEPRGSVVDPRAASGMVCTAVVGIWAVPC